MIKVTRFNKKEFYINCEHIETIESTPDTIITLTNSKKYVVIESIDEIIAKVIEYKKKLFIGAFTESSMIKENNDENIKSI